MKKWLRHFSQTRIKYTLSRFGQTLMKKALDDETLDNFKLVSITKKDEYQPILETDDLAEVVAAIDDTINHFD